MSCSCHQPVFVMHAAPESTVNYNDHLTMLIVAQQLAIRERCVTQPSSNHLLPIQDMVIFGGVNPAADLNDVAIWQGL